MKTKSSSSMGALHPILFFTGMYAVALLFSIFICSSLFYTFNPKSEETELSKQAEKTANLESGASTVALR